MRVELDISKKTLGVLVAIVAIIALFFVAYFLDYINIGAPTEGYTSEREASEAITDISAGVEEVGSIIEDIDQNLGG